MLSSREVLITERFTGHSEEHRSPGGSHLCRLTPALSPAGESAIVDCHFTVSASHAGRSRVTDLLLVRHISDLHLL